MYSRTNITLLKPFLTVVLALVLVPYSEAQSRKQKKAQEKANATMEAGLRSHIGLLASDSLQGRRTGTAGEAMAVAYIESWYKNLGIAPAPGTAGYQQSFVVDEGKLPASSNSLVLDDKVLQWGKEYFAPVWSAPGIVKASTAVALPEQGSPWWIDISEGYEENKGNPHFMAEQWLREKATEAAAKGATALLVFHSNDSIEALRFNAKDRSETVAIPVIYLLPGATRMAGIQPDATPFVTASIGFSQKSRNGTNVVAWMDNGAATTIVLGAHLDHLGYGEDENSRYLGEPAIHNGADDNASGTAALLELAGLLKVRQNLQHNILFVHFSGEELGLYGSKYFTEHAPIDLSAVNYMINMDMIGRLNDSSKALTVGGIGTSPAWPGLLRMDEQAAFTIKVDSSGTGPSDHTSFYRKDIPVLFFFTGLHTDYHKPSDDAEFINYRGEVAIINYIADIITRSQGAGKLAFTKTREQQMGTGRFKVSIGIMPDYTFSGAGVKADGIIEGRPAQKAGVQTGDIILQLGDHLITGMDTYMQALNRFEKGQTTKLTIKRGNEVMEMSITF